MIVAATYGTSFSGIEKTVTGVEDVMQQAVSGRVQVFDTMGRMIYDGDYDSMSLPPRRVDREVGYCH